MERPLCTCQAGELLRPGDVVESCPVCGNARLARPQSTAREGDLVSVAVTMQRATDEDAPEEVEGPPVGSCLLDTLVIPSAIREEAFQVARANMKKLADELSAAAPEKCPVCQGRYPGDHAETTLMKIRVEAAEEALVDAREDLAEALGLDPADLDSFESLLSQVRDLVEASKVSAKQGRAALEEGRLRGLKEAANRVQTYADELARFVVDASKRDLKSRPGWEHQLAVTTAMAANLLALTKPTAK